MSYTQNQPKYEAIQLGTGDGAQDTFITAVGQDPTNGAIQKNDDGTVLFKFGPVSNWIGFAPGDYAISQPYWAETFPGWLWPLTDVAEFDFASRFASA